MKRIFKLAVVVWLVGEWWTRGGYESIFGPRATERVSGDLETFSLWVDLGPQRGDDYSAFRGREVMNPQAETVGVVGEHRLSTSGRVEVRAVFDRSMFGWPINVATAQAEDWTRRSLLPE